MIRLFVKLLKFFFFRVVPVLLLVLAIFIGWLQTKENAFGTMFATVIPLMKGYAPPTIVGHGHMSGNPPVVPADLKPKFVDQSKQMFLQLPGNFSMPQVGLGMCCRPNVYDDVLAERNTLWFLLKGGRLIDTADLYLNHRAIGAAVREAIRRGIPRSEIFITTKIGPSDFGRTRPKQMIKRFLEELGLDYIDLVLLHAPTSFLPSFFRGDECARAGVSDGQCREDSWRSMSEAREEGWVRNVGVSNWGLAHLKPIVELDGVAPIAANQIEFNPWVPQSYFDIHDYCTKNNIAITGYFSLGGMFQKDAATGAEKVRKIAKAHNVHAAQVLLRWALQTSIAIIPGTSNPKHMQSNIDLQTSLVLTDQEMAVLNSLREDTHVNQWNTEMLEEGIKK